MQTSIDLNPEFKLALDLLENSSKNVFVTGRAGTGKSTLLEYFRLHTKKKIVVLAPTGVAALNVNGQTIHSFFGFKPDINLAKVKKIKPRKGKSNIYKKIEAIVIDEISMVRADLLDCVDKFLRLNRGSSLPFGGLQMIFIGDLYQLPPVITSQEKDLFKGLYKTGYFFSSHVFEQFELTLVELEKIYRQKDQDFIDLLNSIRNNTVTDAELEILNKRLDEGFEPHPNDFFIHLTPTKKLSQEINEKQLSKLKGGIFTYEAQFKGNFEKNQLPTDTVLNIKKGAQVMLLNNDLLGRWVNGSIGKIVDVEKGEDSSDIIWVELSNGETVDATPYTWKLFNYKYDEAKDIIESTAIGSFTQYPMKLAWSVTIHKSQGKTFDRVVIDIGTGTFAHGQMYVALSRATSLEGTILKKKIQKKHIFMDWKVVDFLTKHKYKLSEKAMPKDEKVKMIQKAIDGKKNLKIVYLKSSDEKSKRVIRPEFVGQLEYNGKPFLGVEAFCMERKDRRVFRVDRILEMENV
ncbi:AAA family ATPase [candidate division WOR-1 bacterium RIFOXYB2_FULL_37_13]|uniref:AAA family ATPase n=1 Tax=candidate division WOR-1 bacterium RIFOXYB2_FULL_37_13 TaxID=1802579 RepID=A0A1F4SKV0_UNCSA|nr:MAG: AAA family ATPase [candidate division WOR-1 bacterium RIFOXYB2_FULL_37_13]